MQIILLKDIDKLGNMGDVIKVKDGYAANFLIPRKLAKRIGRKSIGFLEDEKRKVALRLKRLKVKAEDLKKKLENLSCTIAVSAGEDEKIHGTVTSEMVKEAYGKEGIDINRRQIHIAEHINKLGVYNIDIKVHPEVTANPKLWVVKK